MDFQASAIWDRPVPDLRNRLQNCIGRGCARVSEQAEVFFRADDIAAPSRNFSRLMSLFSEFNIPLALALVPAWLTEIRWRKLEAIGKRSAELWTWHQHGWRHVDHEPSGKKNEFGPGRTEAEILHDLSLGRGRLKNLIGDRFFPVFTPPWNRCSPNALNLLPKLGFAAVSCTVDALPSPAPGLVGLHVHVDLHTRKEKDARRDRRILLQEIGSSIGSGRCGFMLHHPRMNAEAFRFIEILLQVLSDHPKIDVVGFPQLVWRLHNPGSKKKREVGGRKPEVGMKSKSE